MLVFETNALRNPRYVINFPTKRHWKGKSRIEDIESGLVALVQEVKSRKISSIAIPPLGCGLGGLDWKIVRPLIENAFKELTEVDLRIYEPAGAPAAEVMVKTSKIPAMTPGRAALVELMRQYLSAVMDPFVTLLEVHKLMYFMQEAGEPLKLKFKKAPYGPYAENLRHVLTAIEGHFISGYADAADDPMKPLELIANAIGAAETKLAENQESKARFKRVSQAIEGFESTYGMELLATVHWVAKYDGADSPDTAIQLVHAWSDRKKIFPPEHIALAYSALGRRGWLGMRT
jgi:O-acetyl-ADP-ribose deacetylase (regulator of RNase III)